MDESAKLAEVRAQLAALEASLLVLKDHLQHEQEEQDRDCQEAQVRREEVDRMEKNRELRRTLRNGGRRPHRS